MEGAASENDSLNCSALWNLNFDVIIRSVETIRESNGLACSSRNSYLSREDFIGAGNIYKSLLKVSTSWKEGENNFSILKKSFLKNLENMDGMVIQYAEILDPNTFKSINSINELSKGDSGTIIASVETFGEKPIRKGKIFQVIFQEIWVDQHQLEVL